jgi:hypothetical protein
MTDTARFAAALADRYTIERELGAGGMATVYLAADLKHDRKVAIKVLRPELAAVLGAERFVQEIKTTAALQHPNILPLFDSGEADGFLFYVMPYVEGETLRTKLDRETQLGIDESVRLVTEIADALHYAHAHGVVHRDIKPENILLHAGRPMVADFGIALAVSAAAGGRMTETGLSLGTPHYMSPEQATADKAITNRSDIYSLASVLYEMLTGNPPHVGSSAQQIIMKIIAEPVVAVTSLRKSVPPNVAASLEKALEKLPADRFESAKALAEALTDAHFAGRGQTGVHAGMAGTTPWRSRFYVASAAAVLLATAAIVLLVARHGPGSPPESSVEQLTFTDRDIVRTRWAPDGKTIVFSAMSHPAGTPRLYVVRPDYPEPQPLGADSIQLLAISSAGELAVLTHARAQWARLCVGTLARMPLGGGAPRDVLDGVFEADWTPDGAHLAVTRVDSTTHDRLDVEYPIGRVLYRPKSGYVSDIRFSPGGDRIAFFEHGLLGDNRGVVMVVDTSGVAKKLTDEFWGLDGLSWDRDGKSLLFAGAIRGEFMQVHRATIGGGERLALPSAGSLTLHDVANDGTWLVTLNTQVNRLLLGQPNASGLRDLSWLSGSGGPILSADGQLLAFNDQSQRGGPLYGAMIRKTDGSPAIRLGDGFPQAVSADNRWILAVVTTNPVQFRLYPTGAGQPSVVRWQLDRVESADFFPDGRHLFLCGRVVGRPWGCYRSALDGSAMEPVTPDSARYGFLRKDGGAVAYYRGGDWWVRTIADARTQRIPNVPGGYTVLRWSPDGAALWGFLAPDVQHVERVDVITGRRTPLVTLDLSQVKGTVRFISVTLADDPRVDALFVSDQTALIFSIGNVR